MNNINNNNYIYPAKMLLPNKNISLNKWAVVACDQFTSQKEYWYQLEKLIYDSPSTLNLIFPEAFLEDEINNKERIDKINQTMKEYLNNNIFYETNPCMILIKRTMKSNKSILGLVCAIDLEQYSFNPTKNIKIKATEETVLERIPPRLKIRSNALIELPHVILLMNDEKEKILQNLYINKEQYNKIYDFKLNMDGGYLEGYKIDDCNEIINKLMNLSKNSSFQFVVGDGNHSLATAKTHWDNIKQSLKEEQLINNPARYSLVEIESIYDDGLSFDAIHRVIFNAQNDFISGLKKICLGIHHSSFFKADLGWNDYPICDDPIETIKILQNYIDTYIKNHSNVYVDYIHGRDSVEEICKNNKNAIGILFPILPKNQLFPMIEKYNILPRKTFSMGQSIEKRYYLEAKRIK